MIFKKLNLCKPEIGHETGSGANFEKVSRPKLRLKERITWAKFRRIWSKKYNFSTRGCWNRDIFWYDISSKCITKLKYQDWRFDFYFLMHLIFGCFFCRAPRTVNFHGGSRHRGAISGARQNLTN